MLKESLRKLKPKSLSSGAAQFKTEKLKSASDLPSLIDSLLDLPGSQIDKQLRHLAESHPQATVAELEQIITKKYLRNCAWASGGVGASAAIPFGGTSVAVGLTVAELANSYAQTVRYVLEICRLHGFHFEDREQRRLIVTSAILGNEGAQLISDQLGLSTLAWGRKYLKQSLSSPSMKQVNKALQKYAAKKIAGRTAGRVAGRLIPLGIGAAVGYYTGRKLAQKTVEGVQASLGPIRHCTSAELLVELAPTIEIKA